MIGFIGAGNMSTAMIGGIINSKLFNSNQIFGFDVNEDKRKNIGIKYNINVCDNIEDVILKSKYIILGIKPYHYEGVLKKISNQIDDKVIISIAPLKTIDVVREYANQNIKVVSSMPNTPALVGAGMSAICFSENILENEKEFVTNIFKSFGKVEEVAETLFPAVIAVSGSSPAYVYMFIEALADGAVRLGMPREQAYVFASHAVLGSAKMVLETKEHPGKLKDNVCSPGGTTIEAVASLEKTGFRNSVMEAMDCCVKKINK